MASPLCKTFDSKGGCTSCYSGYDLFYPTCAQSTTKDLNCKTFDNDNVNKCLKCYIGYILNNGVCGSQNPLCRTVDAIGNCLTCWHGYIISGTNCTIDK